MGKTRDLLEGGCSCGKVRYALTHRPLFVHCCHCTSCQRETGSAFALNALIETACVALRSGDVARRDIPSLSGDGQSLMACSDCGGVLWSHYASAKEKIAFVRVGTLDDPSAAPPDIHIFTESKRHWVEIPDGAVAMPAYYRRAEHWPDESIVRYQAALL